MAHERMTLNGTSADAVLPKSARPDKLNEIDIF